jgi:hypothetical protein
VGKEEDGYLAGKHSPSYLSDYVVLKVKFLQLGHTLQRPVVKAPDLVVGEVELGEGNVVLEHVLGDAGQEVVTEVELFELLQGFESFVSHFIQDIVLQVEAADLIAPDKHCAADGEEEVETEVDGQETRQITQHIGHMS